jgi:hydroxymethylbilane synthase
VIEALRPFHDALAERCVRLERSVLAGIGGGCQQPLGAFAQLQENGQMQLRAAYAAETDLRWAEAEGPDDQALVEQVLKGL